MTTAAFASPPTSCNIAQSRANLCPTNGLNSGDGVDVRVHDYLVDPNGPGC
jgi:hypothetical protein